MIKQSLLIPLLCFFSTTLVLPGVELHAEPAIIKTQERVLASQRDFDCLAKNIFYEAGVEDDEGKYAVAQITLNRLETGIWGNTMCKVVYSHKQFSWTNNKRIYEPSGELWLKSQIIARKVLEEGYRFASLGKSLFYHADYVDPSWNKTKVVRAQIGRHIFYS